MRSANIVFGLLALAQGAAGEVMAFEPERSAGDTFVIPVDLPEGVGWTDPVTPEVPAVTWQMAARVLAPEILPEGMTTFSEASRPPCLTSVLETLTSYREDLPLTWAHRLDQVTGRTTSSLEEGRPPSIGYLQSGTYPIRVQYRLEEQLSLAAQVLTYAEESYAMELAMGFYKPLSDNGKGGSDDLDIYLATETRTGGGAFTASTQIDTNPRDKIKACPAYVVLFEGLDPYNEMPVFVAHELNHTFQAAMDYTERTFIKEATAVAMEDLVFDEVDDYYSFIDNFQVTPWYSLNEADGLYPYGAVLFTQFIEEILGTGDGQALAEIWRRTGQPIRSNEPDYLDALGKMAGETGWGNLDALFLTFTGWRYFMADLDDNAHFEEGGDFPTKTRVAITGAWTHSQLPMTVSAPTTTYAEPADLGANYYTVDLAGFTGSQVTVSLAGDPATRWAIVGIRWYSSKPGTIQTLGQSDAGGNITGTFTTSGANHIVLAVANTGSSTFDADITAIPSTYTLTVTR